MGHIEALKESLGLDEVAELVGRSTKTVQRWHDSGRLGGYRVGGRELRFPRSDVEALLATFRTDVTAA